MLVHTLSRVSPSAALKEICLFIDFDPIGHTSCCRRFASSREGDCMGDRWSDFRPLVAAKPPFAAAPDVCHDLGVVCQS